MATGQMQPKPRGSQRVIVSGEPGLLEETTRFPPCGDHDAEEFSLRRQENSHESLSPTLEIRYGW